MSIHSPVTAGSGWYCSRCRASWDQGEDEPADCGVDAIQAIVDATVELVTGDDAPGFIKETLFGGRFHTGGGAALRPGEIPVIMREGGRLPLPLGGYHVAIPQVVDPMARQVGGLHYRDFPVQPTEFAQKNGYDFCSGSILKYLARYRMKNGVEDLQKARHYVEIRESVGVFNVVGTVISMGEFLVKNRIPNADLQAFIRLDAYLRCPIGSARKISAAALIKEIDNLIAGEFDSALADAPLTS